MRLAVRQSLQNRKREAKAFVRGDIATVKRQLGSHDDPASCYLTTIPFIFWESLLRPLDGRRQTRLGTILQKSGLW
jgi:hypothetical protein